MPNQNRDNLQTRIIALKLSDNKAAEVFKALSSQDRLNILKAMGLKSMNVKQIAEKTNLPFSTTAAHIRVLEDAGILMSEIIPAQHGSMKLCTRKVDFINLSFGNDEDIDISKISISMPIGSFSRVIDIKPTCGIVSSTTSIGMYDNPRSFYLPQRLEAQLLWLHSGFVEYRFALPVPTSATIEFIEFSFEACSEAPLYRNPWPSDISLYFNEKLIGIWTSRADLGGRPGRLNPKWWPNTNTQYGYLNTWRVDSTGSYVNAQNISNTKLDELNLKESDSLLVKIGVSENAENVGGMNLFGEKFGDYPQALELTIAYRLD
ncbi:MAG: ArsR/SmtB family transcription factor [Christensenellales bacterium]|jgi:predicted transcriptional regulator